MNENPSPRFESGDTVGTLEDLIQAISGQPKGFGLYINIWWSEQNAIWGKVEQMTGQKILVRIKKMYLHEGKPACLMEMVVA
jgi:hypothetical protein